MVISTDAIKTELSECSLLSSSASVRHFGCSEVQWGHLGEEKKTNHFPVVWPVEACVKCSKFSSVSSMTFALSAESEDSPLTEINTVTRIENIWKRDFMLEFLAVLDVLV